MQVTYLLDRSGSMQTCRDATIEAFNAYLDELKKDREIAFTFLQFDTESLDKLYVAESIKNVRPLSNETFVPRGGTPLIDAAVKTIHAVESSVKTGEKVVICFQTDGQENSSKEHTWEELRGLIKRKQEDGWQFNFMGAGIDAYTQSSKMGLNAAATLSYDHMSKNATAAAFAAQAANTRSFVRGLSTSTNYSEAQRSAAGDRFAKERSDVAIKDFNL